MIFNKHPQIYKIFICVCFFLWGYGCGQKEEASYNKPPGGEQLGKELERATTQDQTRQTMKGTKISGTVVSAMNSGGYTYAEIETKDGKIWAAAAQTEVRPGQKIAFFSEMVMQSFYSKTLDKTFDRIHFAPFFKIEGGNTGQSLLKGTHANKIEGGNAEQSLIKGAHAKADKKAVAPPQTGSILKIEGGYTVEELFSGRESLKGKQVKIRGKVMKFNAGIMGKNWVHLQDGTKKEGQKDVTITTQQTIENGEIIVAEGILAVDKDVGGGYFYPIIIEEGTLTKNDDYTAKE